jgi:hypothetical protein
LLAWVVRFVRRDHLTRIGKDPQQLALEAVEQTSQQEILRRVLFPAPPQIYFPKRQRAGVRIKPGLKVRKLGRIDPRRRESSTTPTCSPGPAFGAVMAIMTTISGVK